MLLPPSTCLPGPCQSLLQTKAWKGLSHTHSMVLSSFFLLFITSQSAQPWLSHWAGLVHWLFIVMFYYSVNRNSGISSRSLLCFRTFWYYTLTSELRGAGGHWMYLLKVNKSVLGIVSAFVKLKCCHPCLSIHWTVHQMIIFSYGLTWLFSSFMWHMESFTHVPSNGSCWLFNGC